MVREGVPGVKRFENGKPRMVVKSTRALENVWDATGGTYSGRKYAPRWWCPSPSLLPSNIPVNLRIAGSNLIADSNVKFYPGVEIGKAPIGAFQAVLDFRKKALHINKCFEFLLKYKHLSQD